MAKPKTAKSAVKKSASRAPAKKRPASPASSASSVKRVKPAQPAVKREKKDDKQSRGLQLLRGMKDITPPGSDVWMRVFDAAKTIAAAYGFSYMETPVLEPTPLFIRSLGKGTEVVDKEMYVFEDKDGTKVCLRPENTAGIARAYIQHGMHTLPQPLKVWYWGSMFRHDRPQAGRYRQFHQFGAETVGEREPVIDAELIALAYNFVRDLGIESTVRVNSLGTPEDRQQYLIELTGYLKSKRSYLSEDSKKRLLKNPLRVLDSKDEADCAVVEEAPQIIDWLSEPSKKYFMSVLEYLDELRVPYVLSSTLVRGLDYYAHTVFELYEDGVAAESQNALGGGGRYDGLIELLGGQPTPGSGFSIGLERVISVVHRREHEARQAADAGQVARAEPRGFFFAQLGEQAKRHALRIMEDLRRAGITLHHNFAKSSLKSQLELADKYNVSYTLILGQKEMQDGTILLRNMESGIQEIIDQKKIKSAIEKIMKK